MFSNIVVVVVVFVVVVVVFKPSIVKIPRVKSKVENSVWS